MLRYERVLTLKANYFAEHFGYDITIILTEGKDKPSFYPLSDKIRVINLNIGFEELWTCSFAKKIFVYLKKQRKYRKLLSEQLMQLRPDITVSLLRREINFINDIPDGSKKVGELHVNRANYRNFEANESNLIKNLFAKFWMHSLVSKLKKLDQFVVLTEEDKNAWLELKNICVIPDPLSFLPTQHSLLTEKRVIAVGRYVYQKGFDLLLQAWAKIDKQYSDW
jgi:glycosyltransferase involved in cell wall biosynthesis